MQADCGADYIFRANCESACTPSRSVSEQLSATRCQFRSKLIPTDSGTNFLDAIRIWIGTDWHWVDWIPICSGWSRTHNQCQKIQSVPQSDWFRAESVFKLASGLAAKFWRRLLLRLHTEQLEYQSAWCNLDPSNADTDLLNATLCRLGSNSDPSSSRVPWKRVIPLREGNSAHSSLYRRIFQ